MKPDEDEKPKGTMVILLVYLAITIVLWLGVYFILLSRGGSI